MSLGCTHEPFHSATALWRKLTYHLKSRTTNLRNSLLTFSWYRGLILIVIAVVLLGLAGAYFDIAHNSSTFLDWLRITRTSIESTDVESGSTTVRNLGLFVAAFFALYIAAWRSVVAGRQTEIARQDLLNERYQKGAEMLGSEVLAVRLGGIYALQRLAEDYPRQYYVLVMRLLCAFIRHPTEDGCIESNEWYDDEGEVHYSQLREDVQTVLSMFCCRDQEKVDLEKENGFKIDLSRSNLKGAVLTGLNLSGSNLSYAKLHGAYLVCVDLSQADLALSILYNAQVQGSNMFGATLLETDVSETQFYGTSASNPPKDIPVRGLTQEALNKARAEYRKPPNLCNVLDADTGCPLVWGGRTYHIEGMQ